MVGGDRGTMGGGEGDDSIVGGRSTAPADRTVIHGDPGDDTIVSGPGNDEIFGDAGSNILAYASVEQQGLNIVDRGTSGVTAFLANPGQTATGGKSGGPEQDIIHDDIGTLVGSNGNDVLVGNNLANQIVGVAPAGTAGVKPGPAGNDVLLSLGGNDLLLGAALAYVSVSQSGLPIVNRGQGVLVRLPEPGATGTGGTIGGQEKDVIHDDLRTLIGSNNGDFLVGSEVADTILGAAPVGTGSGVVDTPAGNDIDPRPRRRRHAWSAATAGSSAAATATTPSSAVAAPRRPTGR